MQTSYPFYDEKDSCPASPELASFLSVGDAPIVFTLGSTAVSHPGNFCQASQDAGLRLGRKAVLIGTGVPPTDSEQILSLPNTPYAEIFPHAAVVVHPGGSGTTGQALRAGRPHLIVPFGWDQPDNGVRVERAGAGLTIARAQYSADTATAALKRLLSEPGFASRAIELGIAVSPLRGIHEAWDALEAVYFKP